MCSLRPQHLDGIHARRTPRRPVAGRDRRDQAHRDDRRERRIVPRLDVVEQTADEVGDRERQRRADRDPETGEEQTLPQDPPGESPAGGAERDAHAELAAPLDHAEGRHSVDPDGGEGEAEAGEDRHQHQEEAGQVDGVEVERVRGGEVLDRE